MKHFLTGRDVYEPVTLRENELEALVPRFWTRVAIGWSLYEWKPLLQSPYGNVRPDGIALADEMGRWAVVEVELASHPETHFRGQFQALESAYYGKHLLASIVTAAPDRDEDHLAELLTREPPAFLCVADEANDKVIQACRDFGFELAVFTPHRSRLGDYAMSVTRFPRMFTEPHDARRYILKIGDTWGGRLPAELPLDFPKRKAISVRFGDTIHDLRVISVARRRRVFLPESFRPKAGLPPVLQTIDPAQGMYELS